MGRPRRKALGQNFLTCREVAVMEAGMAIGRSVIEIGPGRGMLTHELCRHAKRVVAVEIDRGLYGSYGEPEANLTLVNADFFSDSGVDLSGCDMLVSNIPYSMSSRTIAWLFLHRMEAVLCLQREFAEHMTAREGSGGYSRLSVLTSLNFDVRGIARVPAGCFRPKPRVDSMVVHMLPRSGTVGAEDARVIALLMEHKKKTLRNAVIDAREGLGLTKEGARELAGCLGSGDRRVFKLEPTELLAISRRIQAADGA